MIKRFAEIHVDLDNFMHVENAHAFEDWLKRNNLTIPDHQAIEPTRQYGFIVTSPDLPEVHDKPPVYTLVVTEQGEIEEQPLFKHWINYNKRDPIKAYDRAMRGI